VKPRAVYDVLATENAPQIEAALKTGLVAQEDVNDWNFYGRESIIPDDPLFSDQDKPVFLETARTLANLAFAVAGYARIHKNGRFPAQCETNQKLKAKLVSQSVARASADNAETAVVASFLSRFEADESNSRGKVVSAKRAMGDTIDDLAVDVRVKIREELKTRATQYNNDNPGLKIKSGPAHMFLFYLKECLDEHKLNLADEEKARIPDIPLRPPYSWGGHTINPLFNYRPK
jgi:hypothetical protein